MAELQGQSALVTGGGRGLGESVAHSLAQAGARVAIGDIRVDHARRVASAIEDSGGSARPLLLDVTDEDQAERAIEECLNAFGTFDILVNNAGVDVTLPVDELTVSEWDRIIAVNLRGPFVLSRLAFPVMKGQGAGHIVNIVSTAAKRAWANTSAYHASKWGLLGLSHALHVEGRQWGIKVTAVVAGGMRTPFLLERFPDIDQETLQDPANVAETVRYVLTLPAETVIPEITVLPMKETSWP